MPGNAKRVKSSVLYFAWHALVTAHFTCINTGVINKYEVVLMIYFSCTVYPKKYSHGFALLCFVVVIHWLIFPYPSGLLHWHCGNLTIAPVPAKQPWWIWINTSCEFIMNDCITTTKQSTTKPCAYFLGYTVATQKMEDLCVTLVHLLNFDTVQFRWTIHEALIQLVMIWQLTCYGISAVLL